MIPLLEEFYPAFTEGGCLDIIDITNPNYPKRQFKYIDDVLCGAVEEDEEDEEENNEYYDYDLLLNVMSDIIDDKETEIEKLESELERLLILGYKEDKSFVKELKRIIIVEKDKLQRYKFAAHLE
jgi:hypothetical protein